MSDTKTIEADTVVFKAPYVPEDIVLKNESVHHALTFGSDIKFLEEWDLNLGIWKITNDASTLSFYKNDVLKMTLE
jgi:hypothetical protein